MARKGSRKSNWSQICLRDKEKKTETNNKPRRSDRKRDFYHYMNTVQQDCWEVMELEFQEGVLH